MSVVTIALSDTALKRLAADAAVREVRALGLPVRLRFLADRTRGSWYAVHNAAGRTVWRKLGEWPALSAKALLGVLPALQAKFAEDRSRYDVSAGSLVTLADVLNWHLERSLGNRKLSASRKTGLKTAITGHLLPLVEGLQVGTVSKPDIDKRIIWPLQARYETSTVLLDFSALKAATRRAAALKLISADPLAGFKFSDFIQQAPAPKPCRLPPDRLAPVLAGLPAAADAARVLVSLLLMHGTRLGETRRARWADFVLDGAAPAWTIPAATTKTRSALRLPLTAQAVDLLQDYRQRRPGVYLFPASRGAGPLSRQAASKLVKAVSGGRWSAHDLRKSARTAWLDLGVDYMVGEMLLNHAMKKLDQTYIHTLAEDLKRAALVNYHQWLEGQGLKIKKV